MAKQRFIDGIYNYCDRWCERCPHTAVCRVYRDTNRASDRHRRKGKDPNAWDVALKDVSRSFEKTFRMMKRWAKKEGLDLNELAKDSANAPIRDRGELENHPLCKESWRYFEQARKLVDELRERFNDARDDAENRSSFMDMRTEADALARIREAVEVLAWDCSLVHVKTRRALDGYLEAQADEDPDFAMGDASGSASVAIRCLDRDKLALLAIYEWDEQFQNAAIDLLACAERISRGLKQLVPRCTTFVWPPTQEETE